MHETIGTVIIYCGIVIIAIGVFGTYRFNSFYPRILIAADIDTVGFMTVMIGVMVANGLSFFSLKVFLVLVLYVIINPLVTHSVTRSAYFSGYKVRARSKS